MACELIKAFLGSPKRSEEMVNKKRKALAQNHQQVEKHLSGQEALASMYPIQLE